MASAATIDLQKFGATPNDNKDDTAAFRAAFAECAKVDSPTLDLKPGRYDVAERPTPPDGSSRPVFVVKNLKNLTIDGHGAEIVCHDFATLFAFEDCQKLTLKNLKIDYDPLPFTAGQIIATTATTAEVRVSAPQKAIAGLRVESLLPYDPERHRMGMQTKDDIYQPNSQTRTQIIAPDTIRFDITRPLFKKTDWVIVRHQIYSKNAFDLLKCEGVTFENVDVYTAPGMALHANQCADLTLRKFNVTTPPGSERWFTCTADATHFNNCRGTVLLDHCLLESMGDDGANIHNFYLRVRERMDAHTIICQLGKDPTWEPPVPRAGDKLEIGTKAEPLWPYATLTVASALVDDSGQRVAIQTVEPLPAKVAEWDVVGDASMLPHAEVRDCVIRRNRARGVLIQTRHAIVERNTFEDISGAAVQVTCDASFWWEGMPANDVIIENNTIRRVNFGIGSRDAAIDVFADIARKPATRPVHHDIKIIGNTIDDVTGYAIHIGSAKDVKIEGNKITGASKGTVLVDHSENVLGQK